MPSDSITQNPTPEDGTIPSPGFLFRLDNGSLGHAHGLGVLPPQGHPPVDRKGRSTNPYYVIGTSQKKQDGDSAWLSSDILLYSSYDLQHWHYENILFRNTSIVGISLPGMHIQFLYNTSNE